MRSIQALTAMMIGGLSLSAQAACDHPPLVLIPEQEDVRGNEREIVEATQAYFQGMQEYVECIQRELSSAGDNPSILYRNVLVQRNNAAVAEAEAVQRWFNSRFPEEATVPAGGD
jgi:hypothetical protein